MGGLLLIPKDEVDRMASLRRGSCGDGVPLDPDRDWLSAVDASRRLGVMTRTVVRWVKIGTLRARTSGRYYQIPVSEVERIAELQSQSDTSTQLRAPEGSVRRLPKVEGSTSPHRTAESHNRRARKRGVPGEVTEDDIAHQTVRQHGRCYWCGEVTRVLNLEHVVALNHGRLSSNDPENIVTACSDCNSRKGTKSAEVFIVQLLREDAGVIQRAPFAGELERFDVPQWVLELTESAS